MRHRIPTYLQRKASICYKIQFQPQWNSRTAGNKRWFCQNVMKTLEPLQHRSKQSEGDSTRGSSWGLLSHLHTSATLKVTVFRTFYGFPHSLLAKSLQKPFPQGIVKQNRIRTENPQLMALPEKDLQGSPLRIYDKKRWHSHQAKDLFHKYLNCNYYFQFTAFRKTAACCLRFPFLSVNNRE